MPSSIVANAARNPELGRDGAVFGTGAIATGGPGNAVATVAESAVAAVGGISEDAVGNAVTATSASDGAPPTVATRGIADGAAGNAATATSEAAGAAPTVATGDIAGGAVANAVDAAGADVWKDRPSYIQVRMVFTIFVLSRLQEVFTLTDKKL